MTKLSFKKQGTKPTKKRNDKTQEKENKQHKAKRNTRKKQEQTQTSKDLKNTICRKVINFTKIRFSGIGYHP